MHPGILKQLHSPGHVGSRGDQDKRSFLKYRPEEFSLFKGIAGTLFHNHFTAFCPKQLRGTAYDSSIGLRILPGSSAEDQPSMGQLTMNADPFGKAVQGGTAKLPAPRSL